MADAQKSSLPLHFAGPLAIASTPAGAPISTTAEDVRKAKKGWVLTAAATNVAGLICLAGASLVWVGLKVVELAVDDDVKWPRYSLLGLFVLMSGLGICLRYSSGYAFRRSGAGKRAAILGDGVTDRTSSVEIQMEEV